MLRKPSAADQRVTAERNIFTHTPFIWINTFRNKGKRENEADRERWMQRERIKNKCASARASVSQRKRESGKKREGNEKPSQKRIHL